jgi:plastocyanin
MLSEGPIAMPFFPRSFTVASLAGVLWICFLAGCSPVTVDAGRAPSPQAGTEDPPPRETPRLEPAAAPKQKTATVKIDQFAFEPASLTVAPGTTVEWTNHDDVPHTVVDKKVRFKSQALDTDDVYRHTFSDPGTYQYFCSVHPHMVGEIHVKP